MNKQDPSATEWCTLGRPKCSYMWMEIPANTGWTVEEFSCLGNRILCRIPESVQLYLRGRFPLFGGVVPCSVDGESGNKGSAVHWVLHGQLCKAKVWCGMIKISDFSLIKYSHLMSPRFKHRHTGILWKHLECLVPTKFPIVFPQVQTEK